MKSSARYSVNLFPAPLLERYEKHRLISIWRQLLLVAVLVWASLLVASRSMVRMTQRGIQEHHSQISLPQQLIAENKSLRDTLAARKKQLEHQEKLTTQYSPLALMALLAQVKEELGGKLMVQLVQQSEMPADLNSNGNVVLKLVATSAADSARVVRLLEESGYFQEVKLTGPLERIPGKDTDLQFALKCSY